MKENTKRKVLVKVTCDFDARTELLDKFGEHYEFYFVEDDVTAMDCQIESAEIIIGEPDKDELARAKNLKWLQLTWAGVDRYTNMEEVPADLCITNASGAFGKIISEYVIGSIISIYRSFPQYWENQKKYMWERVDSADTIYGKKVLILGTGDIGKNVAHRLKAFGTHIIGIKRTISSNPIEDFDEVYDMSYLDELLPKADIVVACMPNTPETKGVLDYQRFSLMKRQAVFINVGRGSLVSSEALAKVLKEGKLKGAALDVFDVEPLPKDSPLWDSPNLLITPHISGPSFGGNLEVHKDIWNICKDNLERYLNGEPLKNIVNLKIGY